MTKSPKSPNQVIFRSVDHWITRPRDRWVARYNPLSQFFLRWDCHSECALAYHLTIVYSNMEAGTRQKVHNIHCLLFFGCRFAKDAHLKFRYFSSRPLEVFFHVIGIQGAAKFQLRTNELFTTAALKLCCQTLTKSKATNKNATNVTEIYQK